MYITKCIYFSGPTPQTPSSFCLRVESDDTDWSAEGSQHHLKAFYSKLKTKGPPTIVSSEVKSFIPTKAKKVVDKEVIGG